MPSLIPRRSILRALASSGLLGACALPDRGVATSLADSTGCFATLGTVAISNHGTRAVVVAPRICRIQEDVTPWLDLLTATKLQQGYEGQQLALDPAVPFAAASINRKVCKLLWGGSPLGLSQELRARDRAETPFLVEAALPTGISGLSWVVIGQNRAPRVRTGALPQLPAPVAAQKTSDLIAYVREKNPALGPIRFTRLTPNDGPNLRSSLVTLYQESFSSFPYDILGVIDASMAPGCRDNTFVVATTERAGCTSAEVLAVAAVQTTTIPERSPVSFRIGEIGDIASRPGVTGLGALTIRFLLQTLAHDDSLPDFSFTESRLGAVLGAATRAGLTLAPHVRLPLHTEIASARNAGDVVELMGTDRQRFPVEDMAMSYVSRAMAKTVLATYGEVPDFLPTPTSI